MPIPTLDRTDREIVALLQNDSRMAYKQIAGKVGLAASTVYDRIRRLEREGVLQGAHMAVDPSALGIRLEAMLFINLSAHQVGTQETLVEWMRTRPEVRGWFNLAGRLDFAVHVAARDADHLRDIVFHGFTSRPEVDHVETNMIFEQERLHVLPDYLG